MSRLAHVHAAKLMTAHLANYVPRSVTAASPHAAIARERGSLVSMLTVGTVTSLFLASKVL